MLLVARLIPAALASRIVHLPKQRGLTQGDMERARGTTVHTLNTIDLSPCLSDCLGFLMLPDVIIMYFL